jgi:predicted transglutaminase-like cysteine proteinase
MFELQDNKVKQTSELFNLLNTINNKINKFRYVEDKNVHNQTDYWTAYIDKYNAGDCDDYTLTKRRLLIEAGVPYECLLPTVCIVNNEGHLVLIVRTDAADLVMDNIERQVLSVDKFDYKWLFRLEPTTKQWLKL